jgi:hypothetical protein
VISFLLPGKPKKTQVMKYMHYYENQFTVEISIPVVTSRLHSQVVEFMRLCKDGQTGQPPENPYQNDVFKGNIRHVTQFGDID